MHTDSHKIVPKFTVLQVYSAPYFKIKFYTKVEQAALVTCQVNVISAVSGLHYPPLAVNCQKTVLKFVKLKTRFSTKEPSFAI